MRRLDPKLRELLEKRPQSLTPSAIRQILDHIRELEAKVERLEGGNR